MQDYYCYNRQDRIIGVVAALSGDEAWFLATLVQPEVAYLRPGCGLFRPLTTMN